MKVYVEIDEKCEETEVIIKANQMTDEISRLFYKLSDVEETIITGIQGERAALLKPKDIIRFYSSNQRVYAQTLESEYIVKFRLYELEERLESNSFVRISNTDIINLNQVIDRDLSFKGSICIKLKGNIECFVSRRYLSGIKKVLGL